MAQHQKYDWQEDFRRTLGYLKDDIEKIRRSDLKVNYSLALLVLCGCEAIAQRAGDQDQKYEVFKRLLPSNGVQHLSQEIWHAVRDGLGHFGEGKTIPLHGGGHMSFEVSWGNRAEHGIRNERGALVLDAPTLAEGLIAEINSFREKLTTDPTALEKFRGSFNGKPLDAAKTAIWNSLPRSTSTGSAPPSRPFTSAGPGAGPSTPTIAGNTPYRTTSR